MNYTEKIRKLLALAESNNEHEAKAALLKAKALMAEYKISEIDLENVSNSKVKRIETAFTYTKRGEYWIGVLANIIAENYCCRSASSKYHGGQKMTVIFIGLENDVDICATIFKYAVDTARKCSDAYLESMDGWKMFSTADKNIVKNSYAIGFARGVKVAFKDQKEEAGWGLVMVVPNEVNDACSGFHKDTYKSVHKIYPNAKKEGYDNGTRFNPNRRLSM